MPFHKNVINDTFMKCKYKNCCDKRQDGPCFYETIGECKYKNYCDNRQVMVHKNVICDRLMKCITWA